jgi:phosphatidate cytidylyltransferase
VNGSCENAEQSAVADDANARSSIKPSRSSFLKSQEFYARAIFGILLAVLAIASAVGGGIFFALFIGIGTIAAAREWHRMVDDRGFAPEMLVTALTIVAVLASVLAAPKEWWGAVALAVGAGLAAIVAVVRKGSPFWHAFGVVYIGVGALSLLTLRIEAPYGQWVVLGIFVVIWAADTGAWLAGSLIGGPKLVPVLSPNKTWAGFLGGIALAAVGAAIYIFILHGDPVSAAWVAAALAVIGHSGDLFESWVKRQFKRKNSGGLIPGHGGVLDRIDSMLFVAPLVAAIVLFIGINSLFGAHP